MTTTPPPIHSVTRYLRFPLEPDHRAGCQDGSRCPHCDGKRVIKWGRSGGRQRYRCRACGVTFSTFTGTALQHLKKPEKWRRFLWCVDGRLTVRETAAVIGVDKETALRWRHRLLEQWRQESKPKLKGRLVVGSFCMPGSRKGERRLPRPARRRGEAWTFRFLQTEPVTVLVACGRSDAMIIERAGSGEPRLADYVERLVPRVRDVPEVMGIRGPYGAVARLATLLGASYVREHRSFAPARVHGVRRELRNWLRPFRGVSSRRLDNYLEWFRRRGRARADQQFPRTERDRWGGRRPPPAWARAGPAASGSCR